MKPNGAAAFVVDWILWMTLILGLGTGDLRILLPAMLAIGTVGVARKDWAQGRRPFDKIDAQ